MDATTNVAFPSFAIMVVHVCGRHDAHMGNFGIS